MRKKIFIVITSLIVLLNFSGPVHAESLVTPNQCVKETGTCSTKCSPDSYDAGSLGCTSGTCCKATSKSTKTQDLNGVTCDGDTGINTAIGCIHALGNQSQFLGEILRWAVGIGGGIAFLLMIYAGFMIMTSAGNPDRLKAGQELLTSAISGLILLIFSVFVLKFIGIDILGLNQFGFGTSQ